MKEGILILCALLCMYVAYGYPADFQDAAAVAEELDHPKPPKPQMMEQETMMAAETENAQPDLPMWSGMAAVAEKLGHPKPPKPQMMEQETMMAAETETLGQIFQCGMEWMLNAIINGGFSAKAEQVSVTVPNGLRSTGWDVRLQLLVNNRRGQPVYWWWVNYSGNPVFYTVISPGGGIRQFTFGTHPWLVTDANGQLISSVIPYKSDMELTIKDTASWSK